jgi:uroporphyrin-III C-methyltransferase/precorrin-2 dehydrogenase/sirohydrochlorin ferrochelatase
VRHLPIFLDLNGRQALVLGEGATAERKAALLYRAGAAVKRIAQVTPDALSGMAVAIGADAPEAELSALFETCSKAGIPVNVVDRPELSTFIMPAIVDRDPMTIAISSGGVAPVLARLVGARIEALISPAFAQLATLAARFQSETRRRLPDVTRRRRMLEQALSGRVADLALAGRDDEAAAAYRAALDAAERDSNPRVDASVAHGMVFLLGAGPGAADLLTLRAQRLLGEADVIMHDRLVSDEVLDLARRDAERVFVGKARARHCIPQREINALLIKLAHDGKKVVRLKGGDPFIFGRGGEEAEALHRAGIAYEIVPGITAALACAAQARIPLTHRDASRLVTFVTGHTKDGAPDLDYAALVRSRATLAIYMGLAALPLLRDGLLAHGLDPATPAALIERGGTRLQRTLRGTLDELVAALPAWSLEGPTIVLIGPAVGRDGTTQDAMLPIRECLPT